LKHSTFQADSAWQTRSPLP